MMSKPRGLPAFARHLSPGLLAISILAGCRDPAVPEVVVYVAVDRANAEPILRQFEQESGIRVRAVYDAESAKTTGLVSRIRAESGRPRCDVFWNNEVVQTLQLQQLGLLDAYAPPTSEGIPEQFRDADGLWTGVAVRARVIVYNRALVSDEEAPRTLEELAESKWRGKVAMANPQFGTTRTHIAALFADRGPDTAKQWLIRLKENDVRIVDGNAMVKNLVGRANLDASPTLVGLTDTDDVQAGLAEGLPLAMIFPDQPQPGTLVIPSTVCLIHEAPHPDAARRLIDFLVSEQAARQLTADDSGYAPVRTQSLWTADGNVPVETLPITYDMLLDQLQPSTDWTAREFLP